jgi:beta-galactosidase
MGFLVMDEAFDEWAMGKVYYGYHEYFDEWAVTDLVSMLHRDRNHPSIVLWSVGNEIPEQSYRQGPEILQMLVNVVHEEDPSRPVTSACDNLAAPVPTTDEFAGLLDVVGYNYADRWGELRELTGYSVDRIAFPERKMIGSENVSIPGIRGVYTQLPGEWWVRPYYTAMLHAEQLYKFTATHDYVAGDYMWTGLDFLGEARWRSKHSRSGVLDLCGFPKDSFYFYQSSGPRSPWSTSSRTGIGPAARAR